MLLGLGSSAANMKIVLQNSFSGKQRGPGALFDVTILSDTAISKVWRFVHPS